MNKWINLITLIAITTLEAFGQSNTLSGKVSCNGESISFAVVSISELGIGVLTDSIGQYELNPIPSGQQQISVQAVGYETKTIAVTIISGEKNRLDIEMTRTMALTEEVVISGTMQEISRMDCPVAVEVYSSQFFRANPTPSVFEALQNINGVKPQINCNVCNTGDIHINGLEGPYTMVLIDGMPVVSGLATVYGLAGIPASMIERVEIVKGPASTLYGSEAVGGLINIITKKNDNASKLSLDVMATSWGEWNTDISAKQKFGKKMTTFIGINYFHYNLLADHNADGFTDVTLQDRISVFNKIHIQRKNERQLQIAGRYVYEDRWGGDMRWTPQFRGGDSLYGESIYTNRWELYATYDLPLREKITFQCSANGHHQNSYYGTLSFNAQQEVWFGQFLWPKQIGHHELLCGVSTRYTHYNDNTPATAATPASEADLRAFNRGWLPGIFIQDDARLNEKNRLYIGCRYDYHSIHGNIITPRFNYKWNSLDRKNTIRAGIGNGYRVANIFTEDHAALTGSRKVEVVDQLKPETSWNMNIHYNRKVSSTENLKVNFECSLYHTQFGNRIIADYTTDANKIIFANLQGVAISQGVSANVDIRFMNRYSMTFGVNYQDVYKEELGIRQTQLFTETFSAMWDLGYEHKDWRLDYNGKLYSPMHLPLLSELDPRSSMSPWWSLQNIQCTYTGIGQIEIYAGIKNLLNWTPANNNPFLIARAHDPFDKQVVFDEQGQATPTPENPYALTFDPTYVYAPNQGIRYFVGVRYSM